ncbi:MAG: ferredoxin [Oceanospirillaceae bacterium]|jgi:(2Fe-2S) ferredoxin|uniref:(2Fe-2S) ferredoxin domain-containing protein n=1 Tax=Marinobacterium litorale TaxID=404770 RepID=UPI00042A2ED0|nr:(2Fe-2S) ferredoxin domain-containing protein [Marinobacterium litorale]MBS99349.1 ferredoxin [Oceanospirillaceae bacterium]
MPRPQAHVFVCGQQRPDGHPRGSCGAEGASAVAQAFSEEIAKRNLFQQFAVTPTGCLGPCHLGANVLVYPGSHLYKQVKAEDVNRIIEEHLIGGTPVAELLAPEAEW